MGLTGDIRMVTTSVSSSTSGDGRQHVLFAIVESSSILKPIAFLFAVVREEFGKHEQEFFRASSEWILERANSTWARIGANGMVDPESGEKETLAISDPRVRERYESELNFWRKEVVRRKKSKNPKPSKKKP